MDNKTPEVIVDLFQLPYCHFSDLFGMFSNMKFKSLIDIASGEALHRYIVAQKWEEVIYYDKMYKDDKVKIADIRHIPEENKTFDVAFCFETLEHMNFNNQIRALLELKRVTKNIIIIGSVDEKGLDFVKGERIFKKYTGTNPWHKRELNVLTFPALIENVFDNVEYYHTDENMKIVRGLTSRPKGFCNYAVVGVS